MASYFRSCHRERRLRGWMMAVLLAALGLGCGPTPTEPSVPFRQLRPVGLGGPFTCEPGVRVVQDAGEWAAISAELQFVEPPVIGFGAEQVVLISLGARSTSGYSVEVQDVRGSGRAVVIEAVEVVAGRCAVLPVVTCPGAIVVVPRSRGSVEVEWGAPRTRPGCE